MAVSYGYLGPQGFGVYDVDPHSPEKAIRTDGKADKLLVPGFVDIHIHGAFGIDFMVASSAEIVSWAEQLKAVGYEAFLPTTVTCSPADALRALDALPEHPMIAGFHLEGPFISPVYPGAQPQEFILTADALGEWEPVLNDPRLKVITLAPEVSGCLELTERLANRGVKVSMGHTNATYAEAQRGFEHGAVHTTHTYNAMRGLHHREAGMLGFALDQPQIQCELIYDRIHVSNPAASVLLRCKGADHVIAISDSAMATGMPVGTEMKMWGLDVIVGDKQVRLKDGTLAGSGITLLDAFRNLYEDFGAEVAIKATSLTPRKILQLGQPTLYNVFDCELNLIDQVSLPASMES